MRFGVVSQRCEGGRGLANERGVCGGGLCETVGGLWEVKGIKGGSCGGGGVVGRRGGCGD